jgi:hypothetical protein
MANYYSQKTEQARSQFTQHYRVSAAILLNPEIHLLSINIYRQGGKTADYSARHYLYRQEIL